ncbi:MAG TPA: ABC transporter substrate-binding protein [Pseudolabrys sp.]|jgi:putative ABC transport system substrate-binding protein|nr:ABC transporter substrate-binding protein [Pseudolabrys sp.]
MSHVRRREFITLIGGAVALPFTARARQGERMRRIGVLMPEAENDPETPAWVAAFQQSLEKLGWSVGRNILIDYHWYLGEVERARAAITQMLPHAPDLILAVGSPAVVVAQETTRTIPVVFVGVSEPIAQGFVASLARPGGNISGFTNLERSLGAKWLEVLEEIAPHIARVAFVFNPDTALYAASFFPAAKAAASKYAVELVAATVHQIADVEAVTTMLAHDPGGGLIFPPDPFFTAERKSIVELAARYRLPAIYPFQFFPADGGLVSYGVNIPAQFQQAAAYVDRILRGAEPSNLPVQQPTKLELVINLKTAKTLGLEIPPTLLALADEVIE